MIFSCNPGHAQKPFFKRISINRENTTLKFNAILCANNGFLWFGSSEGLYKYDGSESVLMTINTREFDNSVSALFQDGGDTIWVGYKSGQVAYVLNDVIHLFKPDEGLPKKSISSLSKDKYGNLWIATTGEGVYFFNNSRLYNINMDDGLNENYVYVLTPEPNGNMWVGTDEGIALCTSSVKNKVKAVYRKEDGLPDNIVRVITYDPQGNLWIGMQEMGICKFLPQAGKFSVPPTFENWTYGQVNQIEFNSSEMWIATEEKGLLLFDKGLNPLPYIFKEFNSYRFSRIADLTVDREGNLWMIANSTIFQSLGSSVFILDRLPLVSLKMIHTLMFDHSGKLWFSPDQGLVSYNINDTSSNRIKKFTITPEEDLIDIVSLYEDGCDYIWVGTMGAGLFRLNPRTGHIQHIVSSPEFNKASIMSITGKDDEIWIATLGGAYKINLPEDCNTNKINIGCTKLENENLLGNFYLYDVFLDSKNRVWFGTDGKGLTCIDNGKYYNYNENNGIASNVIYSITEDKFGNIWFSTLDAGIYKFDGAKFKNYNQADGLRFTSISSILADKKGQLIIVHRHGFDVLDIENETITYYGSEIGITDMNSDLNAIDCDKNGRVWIGTEDQIISYHAHSGNYSKKPLSVISKASLFTSEIGKEVNRRLSYDQNYISFDFIGLWYTNPDRVKYQYMLEGYNKEWILTRDRSVIFPNLPPGKYNFKIRTSINKSFRQYTEAAYPFIIHPPFWKENWFIFMLSLILSSIIYLIISIRTRQIRRLEALKNEKIEFQYETLKSQVNPHFLFNSFNTLISVIEEDKKKAIEYVESLSVFFRNIVFFKDYDLISLNEEITVANNYFFLQKKRYGKNLTMDIDIPENTGKLEIPPMVLQILIENAIKHNAVSSESPLRISITCKNNILEIKNNINPKRTNEQSTKSGLQNIINRFKILTSDAVEVIHTDHEFTVRLPLIKP